VITLHELYRLSLERDGKEVANIRHSSLVATYTIAEVSASLAKASAILRRDYRIPLADSLIAATAMAEDKTLWTDDPHLGKISGLKIKWTT